MLGATLAAVFLLAGAFSLLLSASPALASRYYKEQVNFTETAVPKAGYRWDKGSEPLQWCVHREKGVEARYYAWTKLAALEWRKALREYTGDSEGWDMTVRQVPSKAAMQKGCDVRVHIHDTYKDFPGYPAQTGAYTAVEYSAGVARVADVYMSPRVMHGDGTSEIDLPAHAFRNSAIHEAGHVLGLGHMATAKGYLMSPVFDFWEHDRRLPITTLELSALVETYGPDGF